MRSGILTGGRSGTGGGGVWGGGKRARSRPSTQGMMGNRRARGATSGGWPAVRRTASVQRCLRSGAAYVAGRRRGVGDVIVAAVALHQPCEPEQPEKADPAPVAVV